MARKAGQLISRGPRTWLVRVSLGRDPETGTRKYHNKTIRSSFREAPTYPSGKVQEREIGWLPHAAAISLNQYLDQWLSAADFVIHSLRHTMLTRMGEAGADAFTIMRIAGHSSVTVSQRYVHPTPEGLERAFARLENLNAAKFEQAETEAKAEATNGSKLVTKLGTAAKRQISDKPQVVEINSTG